ncbi:MAG: hypothetical protein HQK75_19015, partial [Candidatus Magnetomorum sp.]|nr:hypothetical protein [Candidatus Magnetomorum sp.]
MQSFILTVNPVNDTPVITADTTLSVDEDTVTSFSLTATDVETAGCSLDITWHSSDVSLLPDESISYTCDVDVFYFTMAPVSNQSGNVSLSFTITDSGSLNATHTLDVTVIDINDTPFIGTVANQSTDNRTAITALSITGTDEETATCDMTLSLISSDSNIFPSNNMTYTCSSNTFYMSFTPSIQYYGTTTITVMATDAGGMTASTTFDIDVTSTGPNFAPVIGTRVNRWMDINLRNAYGIWAYDENNIFLVGTYGDIMHYDGERVTPMHTPTQLQLNAVWGTSLTNVYCVGNDGMIFHYDGRNWTQMTACTVENLYAVWGLNENSVYAGGYNGDFCHYTGTTWTDISSNYSVYLYGIWGTSENNLYFAENSSNCVLSYDGSAWAFNGTGCQDTFDVWGADASNMWFVGDYGVVYHYDGSTKTDQTIGSTVDMNGIWGSDINNVFAVGDSGIVKIYNGSSWTETDTGSDSFEDVWGIDANNVYAITSVGKIYKYTGTTTFGLDYQNIASNVYGIWANSSTDIYLSGANRLYRYNGTNWTEISGDTSSDLNSFWSDGSIGWAVGDNGYVFYYDGSTLTRDTSITGSRLYDVWGSSASDVFAVGETGLIRYYNGSTWSVKTSGTSEHLKGIYGTASSNVLAVGENGTIVRYNGSTWSSESSGVTETLNAIWANNSSDIYAVGNNGTVLHYNGSSWLPMEKHTSQNLNGVWGNGSGDIYSVGNYGTILHYNGTTWDATFTGETFDLYDIGGSVDTIMLVGNSRTVKQLYNYDYSETQSKTISANVTNEPFVVHINDYNGDTVSVSAISSDQSILPDGNITITGTGNDRTILVTPLTDQYGTLTLTVSVDDGLSQTTTQIYLHVSQPPVISSISSQTIPEDTILKMSLPVSAAPDEICGLHMTVYSDDTDLIREMVTDCEDNNYTLTIRPVPSQSGNTTITITATDASGAYTEQSFSLTVTPVNDPPKIGVSSNRWTAPMRHLLKLESFSDGSVVAVTNHGKIYHYVNQQWQLEPSETTNDLNAIWGLSGSSIYVGGYAGQMIHFDGSAWSPDTSNTSYEIWGIWGSAANDIFAVCTSGKIIHYDGASWSLMTSNTPNLLNDVDGNAFNDVYACGYSGTIMHYAGSSWSEQTSGTNTTLTKIICLGTNAVFAIGGSEILYYNGSTWSNYSAANTVYDIWGVSGNDVYAVGSSGKIYHFDGSSWSEMTSNTIQILKGIWGKSSTDIYAVGNVTILHYDGMSWSEMPQNFNQNFIDVTGTNDEVFAASSYGIYKYNGINWSETTMDSFWEEFVNIGYIPAELMVMNDGRIIGANSSYYMQYSGTVWTYENTGVSLTVKDIWSDGTDIFIVGTDGNISHYDGATWSQLSTGTTLDFYGIWGTRKNNLYIAAENGTVFHYDGTTFTSVSLNTSTYFNTIWGSGFSDIYVGTYRSFFHFNGREWERMDPGLTSSDSAIALYGRHSHDIYLAGTNGKITHSNGFCWSSLASGTSSHFQTIWLQKADEIYAGGDLDLLAQSDGQAVTILDCPVYGSFSDIDGGEDYVIATGSANIIRKASIISIPDQTIYADSQIHSIPFVVSDPDGDSVNVSVSSSSLTLLTAETLSISGTGSSYALLITPTVHSSLPITITISANDGSLTQNESFMLYLRKVNAPPELAIIPNIGTAAGEISFTFVETDGDTVSLTVTSSDQSLIADANIQIVGGTANTTILATSAYVEQNVILQLTQETGVHGLATITVEASATGGTVTETFNVIVSPPGPGNALTFNGVDEYLTTPNSSLFNFGTNDNFAICLWVYIPNDSGSGEFDIVEKWNSYTVTQYPFAIRYVRTTKEIYFERFDGTTISTAISSPITHDQFFHLAAVKEGSMLKLYINGVLDATATDQSAGDTVNNSPLAFACRPLATPANFYQGKIDELSIWNIGLSENDIRNLMCKRLSGSETGLVLYHRFDHISGTTVTDLSGNNLHGTFNNMTDDNWITSTIALGDNSTYDYTGSVSSDFSVSLSHSDGDAFTAFGDSGSYSGLHIYLVNEPPSTYTAPAGFSILYTDHYFGVFPVGITPTYSISYNYIGNTAIASDNGLRLASRSNNAGTWLDSMSDLNTSSTTLVKTGIAAFSGISTTEFIPGVNFPPSFGSVSDQTITEDSTLRSIPIAVTDTETLTCSLDITFTTSQPVLLSVGNIAYTCNADMIYVSLTPTANQSGFAAITITASDAGGAASSISFGLTITEINDAPIFASSAETANRAIDFTYTVAEITSVALTITSSDPSLIDNSNINISGSGSNSYSYVTGANAVQTVSVAYTPVANAHGRVTLTVTAS